MLKTVEIFVLQLVTSNDSKRKVYLMYVINIYNILYTLLEPRVEATSMHTVNQHNRDESMNHGNFLIKT